jgi:putative transposase
MEGRDAEHPEIFHRSRSAGTLDHREIFHRSRSAGTLDHREIFHRSRSAGTLDHREIFHRSRSAGTPTLLGHATFLGNARLEGMGRLCVLPIRKTPNRDCPGIVPGFSIVFLTVCAKDRKVALAEDRVHEALVRVWFDDSRWRVGAYVIMPDHIHLLCREAAQYACSVNQWAQWWKREVSIALGHGEGELWQSGIWDRRLYSPKAFEQKVDYIKKNPVGAGLVRNPSAWPYSGAIHDVRWLGRS